MNKLVHIDGVMVDGQLMSISDGRMQAEQLLFKGKDEPVGKYELAARKSFMNTVESLMKDGGRFVKIH